MKTPTSTMAMQDALADVAGRGTRRKGEIDANSHGKQNAAKQYAMRGNVGNRGGVVVLAWERSSQ